MLKAVNSRKVKALMVEQGDSQQQLAEFLGISRASLANKLNGRVKFTAVEVLMLFDRYRAIVDSLESLFLKE